MDVLAAIALATEAPHPTELKSERIKKNDNSLTPVMWRSISSQVLYQFIVLAVLLYAGPTMFGIPYNLVSSSMRDPEGVASYRMQHYTLLFQSFVMMNLFNMVNCRKLPTEREKELNIFSRIHHNWWFLIVLGIELNLQFFMIGYPFAGIIFSTTTLTLGMQITAVSVGAGSWLVALLVKMTPYRWVSIFPEMSEDETEKPGFLTKVDQLNSQMFRQDSSAKQLMSN